MLVALNSGYINVRVNLTPILIEVGLLTYYFQRRERYIAAFMFALLVPSTVSCIHYNLKKHHASENINDKHELLVCMLYVRR